MKEFIAPPGHVPLFKKHNLTHLNADQKAVASINARMGSTRLPGKVLMKIGNKTVLDYIVDRLRACTCIYDICLATTFLTEDDVLVKWAMEKDIPVYRGEVDDCLSRVVECHQHMDSAYVVRVCGDTPFIDAETIDYEVLALKYDWCDIIMANDKRRFPFGVTAHACKLSDLQWVNENIDDPACREHVTLYLYENPDKYRVMPLVGHDDWVLPGMRLQIDYPEDLEVANYIVAHLGEHLTIGRIVQYLKGPEGRRIRKINADCEEKPVR